MNNFWMNNGSYGYCWVYNSTQFSKCQPSCTNNKQNSYFKGVLVNLSTKYIGHANRVRSG